MRNRRAYLKGLGAASIALTTGCLGGGNENNSDDSGSGEGNGDNEGGSGSTTLQFGTGTQGGSSYTIGVTFSEYLKQEGLTDRVELNPVETQGTVSAYRRTIGGELDIGGSDTKLMTASPDQGPFAENPLSNFEDARQIRGYFQPFEFFVTREDSGIKNFEDLEGERVYISSTGSGSRPIVERLIDTSIGMDNIEPYYSGWGDVPSLIHDGEVAAATVFNTLPTVPTPFVTELDSRGAWRPVEMTDSMISLIEEDPSYSMGEIDGGEVYENYNQSVTGFSWGYVYVTTPDVDSEVIYELTKLSYEYGDELAERNESLSLFPSAEGTLGTMHNEVPIHKGAWQYYEEEGLLDDFDLTEPPEL